ncbi:MAG: class E sortase [Oscillospiraceae bacterium]|nr:class E sortase [Oscillospiraceae bacterium]MDD7040549.1 class E sortase [Oscillospiraceae bacterium]MDY2611228.1 class E sortase [Oscillospiraceae bacterium]
MEITQPEEKRRLTRRQAISLILAGLGLILLVTGLWMMRSPEAPPERGLELSAVSLAEGWSLSQVRQDYPVGKLVVTTDREAYENGNLRLVIPSLDQDVLVQNNVDTESLRSGPGLYEYSQLPAPDTNANVSIAGHRDIEGAEFYYIDRLTDGDLMYLVYQEKVYIYQYESTQIIQSDDWNPIACKDYPCLTLTSCDPIGTFINRIVVTGRLVDVWEMNSQVMFAAKGNADSSVSQAQ